MLQFSDDLLSVIVEFEHDIRLYCFAGSFIIFGILEAIFPRKKRVSTRLKRWFSNLGIVALSTLFARLVFTAFNFLLPVSFSAVVQFKGWGILNQYELSNEMSILITILLLDVIVYLQHVMFHHVPLLWRFHKVHHTDLDLDVSSGNRFHPVEIVISLFIKMGAIALIGPMPAAVIIFEVLLNGLAQFNHSNLKFPIKFDKVLRWILVTPDVHRTHHSIIRRETNSNYGFNLTWWDRIFGTFIEEPKDGHENMVLGLSEFRDSKKLHLHHLLILPIFKKAQRYSSTEQDD